ncbi:MAG: glycosyltransferase family 2 protein [Bradyrhizobium sp.]|nr:MAG: glycosyltransferase family 2 protein [Bradyrhizobium sp.]
MPSPRPAISVVIPTRNRHAMLAEAIGSVLRQDWRDHEIVVVDDGEGAADFLARRFAQTPAIRCADNRHSGQVRARNLGVSLARGDIVAFLDDDDLWGSPAYLGAVRAAIAGDNAASVASGEIVTIDGDLKPIETIPFAARTDPQSIRADNKILVSGFAFARTLSERLGPFDEIMPIYWDWDWYLRLHEAGVVFHDLGPQDVKIRVHAEATSRPDQSELRRQDLGRLSAKHGLGPLTLRNHESIARDEATGEPA